MTADSPRGCGVSPQAVPMASCRKDPVAVPTIHPPDQTPAATNSAFVALIQIGTPTPQPP